MKKIISLFALALLTMSAWAANTYVKVTSLDQLEAGKKYILVNEENSRAMGPIAGTSTTYGSAISVTIISGVIDIEDTDVVELTAADGGTHSYGPTWHFTYDDGAYMFWNSGNSLSTISTDGANMLSGVKWVPASTDDGVILKSNGDFSRILQYNASSPRFACYTTTQKPAVLYVQDESVEPPVYTKPYVKVTSLDQLEAGKKYILVNEGNKRAMGALSNTSTNYGTAVEIAIAYGVIDIDGTSAVELTLGEGSKDEFNNPTWTFDMGGEGHFICWTSGNSLNSVNNASPNNAMWFATATDDGVVLSNKTDNTRKLQYNASSPRFACYTTSQQPAVLYVEYVPAEEEGITKLSEANALEDGESFTFNGDAVVTICWKGSVYVRDESGYGQIANYDGTFENGQVLSQGWNATKTSVDGWVKFIDAADLSASGETNAELAAAQKLTSVDESMLNAYVYVEKVYKSFLPIRAITLADGTTISLTGTGNQPATGNYNIYGIIWKSGDALVFEPVAWETYVEPPTFLRGDVNKDTEVNIADVTALIDKLLNNAEMIPEADCNQDTEMNIADVTALIDYLLNGAWPN